MWSIFSNFVTLFQTCRRFNQAITLCLVWERLEAYGSQCALCFTFVICSHQSDLHACVNEYEWSSCTNTPCKRIHNLRKPPNQYKLSYYEDVNNCFNKDIGLLLLRSYLEFLILIGQSLFEGTAMVEHWWNHSKVRIGCIPV